MKTKNPEEYIRIFSSKDRMGSLIGTKIIELGPKECISEYKVSEQHYNPNGVLHGGTLYAVMDSSQGAFLHFNLDPQFKFAVTGTSTIKYLAPVFSGTIRIRTWMKEAQGRKFFVNSSAVDESGREVATLEEIWIATYA